MPQWMLHSRRVSVIVGSTLLIHAGLPVDLLVNATADGFDRGSGGGVREGAPTDGAHDGAHDSWLHPGAIEGAHRSVVDAMNDEAREWLTQNHGHRHNTKRQEQRGHDQRALQSQDTTWGGQHHHAGQSHDRPPRSQANTRDYEDPRTAAHDRLLQSHSPSHGHAYDQQHRQSSHHHQGHSARASRDGGRRPPAFLEAKHGVLWSEALGAPLVSETTCEEVQRRMKALGVRRVVVGHTTQQEVTSVCGGLVWRVDCLRTRLEVLKIEESHGEEARVEVLRG